MVLDNRIKKKSKIGAQNVKSTEKRRTSLEGQFLIRNNDHKLHTTRTTGLVIERPKYKGKEALIRKSTQPLPNVLRNRRGSRNTIILGKKSVPNEQTKLEEPTWHDLLTLPFIRSLMILYKLERVKTKKWVAKNVLLAILFFLPIFAVSLSGKSMFLLGVPLLITTIIIATRFSEFRSYAHIPGPQPSFLWGNYNDLNARGWNKRHYTLTDMHKKYGPVIRLHMPLFKNPFVITDFVSDHSKSKELDALRPSRTIAPWSLMGMSDSSTHALHRRFLSQFNTSKSFREIYIKKINQASTKVIEIFQKHAEYADVFKSIEMNEHGENMDIVEILIKWGFVTVSDILFDHIPTVQEQQLTCDAIDLFVSEISHRTWEPMYMWLSSYPRIYNFSKGYRYLQQLSRNILLKTKVEVKEAEEKTYSSTIQSLLDDQKKMKETELKKSQKKEQQEAKMRENGYQDLKKDLAPFSGSFQSACLSPDTTSKGSLRSINISASSPATPISARRNSSENTLFSNQGKLPELNIKKGRSSSINSNSGGPNSTRMRRWSSLQDTAESTNLLMNIQRLPKESRVDEIVLDLAASFQSTGDTIAMCLWHLANNKPVQDKAFDEITKTTSLKGGYRNNLVPDHEDIHSCDYIKHVWYETLRVTPAIPFSARKVTKNVQIEEFKIPGGCYLMYFKNAVGMNEKIFENPKAFDPDRYLKSNTKMDKLEKFIPFGVGKRSCLGQQLAEYSSIEILMRLVVQFEFYVDGNNEEAEAVSDDEGLDLQASVGIKPTNMSSLKWRVRHESLATSYGA